MINEIIIFLNEIFDKIFFSFFRCREFVSSYHHADVDVDTDHVWEHQWDQFLTDFYLICHENSKIQVYIKVVTEKKHFLTILRSKMHKNLLK